MKITATKRATACHYPMTKDVQFVVILSITMLYAFLMVLCLFGSVCANKFCQKGKCPNFEVEPAFNISKYLGKWYRGVSQKPVHECATTNYSPGENGAINVLHTFNNLSTGKQSFKKGVLRVPDARVSAKLKFSFTSSTMGEEINYWILGTDYDSFVVFFTCSESEDSHFWSVGFMSREQCPSAAVIEKADKILKENKIYESCFKNNFNLCKVDGDKNLC